MYPLNGRRVCLEPVTPDHYGYLYELSCHPALSYRWLHRGLPPTFDAFVTEYRTSFLAQFLVRTARGNTNVGIALAFGEDFRHGHCQLAIAMHPELVSKGLGVEAGSLLLDYVFGTWPFHAVYFEAPAFNESTVSSGRGSNFETLGILRHHRYFDGRYWDEHILSVTRESWERSSLRHSVRGGQRSRGRTALNVQARPFPTDTFTE